MSAPKAKLFLTGVSLGTLVFVILEIWLLILIGNQIGFWQTFGLVLITTLVGAFMLQREGLRAWQALMLAFTEGRLPTGELADAALVLLGGLMLMTPGFISDVIGLVLLIPFTRPLVRKLISAAAAWLLPRPNAPEDPQVISGEVVVEDPIALVISPEDPATD